MSYPPLQPGDYYIENGKWVFTAQYHLRRGICCGNACRHCPFEHVNVPEEKRVVDRSCGVVRDVKGGRREEG